MIQVREKSIALKDTAYSCTIFQQIHGIQIDVNLLQHLILLASESIPFVTMHPLYYGVILGLESCLVDSWGKYMRMRMLYMSKEKSYE